MIDRALKVFALLFGVCYGSGWIISGIYKGLWSISDFDVVSQKYVIIGFMFYVYALTPSALIWLLYIQVAKIVAYSKSGQLWPHQESRHPVWIRVVSVVAAVIFSLFLLHVVFKAATHAFMPFASNSLGESGLFILYATKSSWMFVLLTIGVVCVIIDLSNRSRNLFNYFWTFSLFSITLVHYSATIYPEIKQTFGGGMPQPANMHIDPMISDNLREAGVSIEGENALGVMILYEDSQHVYIQGFSETVRSAKISRNHIRVIYHLTVPR